MSRDCHHFGHIDSWWPVRSLHFGWNDMKTTRFLSSIFNGLFCVDSVARPARNWLFPTVQSAFVAIFHRIRNFIFSRIVNWTTNLFIWYYCSIHLINCATTVSIGACQSIKPKVELHLGCVILFHLFVSVIVNGANDDTDVFRKMLLHESMSKQNNPSHPFAWLNGYYNIGIRLEMNTFQFLA